MSLNNNPFSGPNPFPPNEQMPEDQLLTIVQTISHCLHLPLPQNPLTLQFVIKVIRKIFGTHFTGKNWQEAIQFLEREVLGEQEGVIQAQENIDAPNLKKGLHNQEQIYEVLSLLADLALMTAKQDNQQEEIAILKENTKILQNRDSRQRGKKEVKVVERKTKDRQKNTSQRHKEVKNNFPMKTPPLINSSRPKSSTLNQARSKHLPMSSKVDLKMDLQTEVIKTVKQTIARKINTHDMRVCKLMHDQKSDQAVKKAKRTFDYQIKQYRRELKTAKLALRSKDHKTSKYPPEKKQQFVDSAYLKYIKKKHQNIQEEVMSQQLRYYLALRQKKLTYIQHIHKLLSQLQRQRQIDLHKAQREQYQSQKKLAKQKIAATDNIFKNNMEDLKEQFRKRKIENQTKNVNEVNFCREMEKAIVKKKQQQMQQMKVLWEMECQKLKVITGDQGRVEARLLKVYRENRV